jgi:hypothetical protein
MSAAIAKSVVPHQDVMAPLRASVFESAGLEVERAEKPVVVYMDHQVSVYQLSEIPDSYLYTPIDGG